MGRIDAQLEYLDYDAFHIENVYETVAGIVKEAGDRALRTGLPELYQQSLEFNGAADDLGMKFLGRCVAACIAQLPGEQAPQSAWLSVEQAAPLMGMAAATLKEWCNHIDPKTGRYAPKIEHIRVGTCGRPNLKNGRRGKIKIHRDVVATFVADRTASPLVSPAAKPATIKRQPFRSSYFSHP